MAYYRKIPVLSLSLALLWAGLALAQGEAPSALLGEGGKNQASVSQGRIKALMLYKTEQDQGAAAKVPHLYLMLDGKPVITLKGVSSGSDWPQAEAIIAELDPSNPYPELVFTTFSGGAHCCTHVLIATSSPDGTSWKALHAGDFDGGINLADIDGDRRIELQVKDQRFDYMFASYAGSVSPPIIYQLQGAKLIDVTRQAPFRPFLRAKAERLDRRIAHIDNQDQRNGLLAGYVALKGLMGQGAAAWNVMMRAYDRKASEGLTGCQAGYDDNGKCKAPQVRYPNFPKALEAFLKRTGYL